MSTGSTGSTGQAPARDAGGSASVAMWLATSWLFVAGATDAQTVSICQIQGKGPTPTFLTSRVTVTGVVTADFTATGLGGFFVQDPSCDGDPGTSDGIWVQGAGRVIVGNRVTVTGRVADDSGLTSLVLEDLSDGGPYSGGVEAVRLTPPADPAAAAAYLEAHEGMLVSLPASRVVAATDHSGEAYLMPESSGVTRLYRGDLDGRKLGFASPSARLPLNHGDRLDDVSGPLSYALGDFEVLLRPERPPALQRANVAPVPSVAAPLTLATCNLENLFAQHVLGLVDELKASEPAVPVIVMGDLNDFEDSPTLLKLTEGGRLVNALGPAGGQRPYTYVFQGLSQALDHVLVDASLAPRVLECVPVHVNVDFGDPGPGAPLEAGLRASDHDPVRLTLRPR